LFFTVKGLKIIFKGAAGCSSRLLIIRKLSGYQRPQKKDDTAGRSQEEGGGQGKGQIFHPWPDREPLPEMFQKAPKLFGKQQDKQEKAGRKEENIYHERLNALWVQAGGKSTIWFISAPFSWNNPVC
jgi:hypothetical protein